MSQKILRSLFGDPAETLEDRGDELRLNGFQREAVYFYRQALACLSGAPSGAGGGAGEAAEHTTGILRLPRSAAAQAARRQGVARKLAECREAAFRQILDEAESLVGRGRRREALTLLADAEQFAETAEEVGVARARRQRLESRQSTGGAPSARAPLPPSVGMTDGEDHAARIERLTAEIATHPESAQAHELLGEAYRECERLEEARLEFEAAYRRNPERLRLVIEAARILRQVGRGQEAGGGLDAGIQRLELACRQHRPTAASLQLHCERLLWLAEAGRVEEALAGFSDLLSVTGLDRGFLYFNRAGVQEQAGLLEGARLDLEAAILAAPENLIYRERLADVCLRLRDHLPDGLRALEEALALDAHDFARRSDRVADGRRTGFASIARPAWGSGTFSPDQARLQFKAARILYLLERDVEARSRVEKGLIICRDPRVEEALLELRRSLGA